MFPQHLGDYIDNKLGVKVVTLDNSNTDEEGAAIDRQDFYSGVATAVIEVTDLEAQNEIKLNLIVSDSDASDGTFAEYDKTSVTLDATGSSVLNLDLDLKAAKRYLKVKIDGDTGDDSVDASNKADVAGILTLGGAVDKPVS